MLLLLILPAASDAQERFLYDEAGFLVEGEFILEDPAEGIWQYNSPSLRIDIVRKNDKAQKLIWYEADIYTQGDERFHMIPKNREKRMNRMDYMHNIAAENGVVFALNSDFAHHRIQNKMIPGILIREGEIVSNKTRNAKSTQFPNLDTLAIFGDGDMKVFRYNEYTAEEYIQMGAADVLAFGPILIRDGETDEKLLSKHGQYREPRSGIGMAGKGHYVAIMVEGRHADSRGMNTAGLAELFHQKGCTLAFNLDGGLSSAMVFMGRQIVRAGANAKAPARSTAEILGIGFSAALMETLTP
jgi:hypothetical protein